VLVGDSRRPPQERRAGEIRVPVLAPTAAALKAGVGHQVVVVARYLERYVVKLPPKS
jgi:hypothetical protein